MRRSGSASSMHWLVGGLVLTILAGGCSSSMRFSTVQVTDTVQWPLRDPRVKLEQIIGNVDVSKSATLARFIVGGELEELLERPFDVAWAGDDLIVLDSGARKVFRITPGGRAISSRPGLFELPVAVEACPIGIVVSDSAAGVVALLDADLKLVRFVGNDFERPTGLACQGDSVLVAETARHRIAAVGPDGERRYIGRRGDGPGEFNYPTLLMVRDGALWVGDALNFRLQAIDPISGTPRGSFGTLGDAPGEMPRMKGLERDSLGRIWLSDAHLDQVALYEPNGDFLISLGGQGFEPGRFSFPAGIAASSSGLVAVADSLNRRVQIFRLLEPQPPEDPNAP